MDKEGENVIVCGIALGLAVLGWAVSRKWGRKDWQKGAAVIAAAACLGLLSGYMELQTDEDPEKGLLRRENGEGDYEADLRMYVDVCSQCMVCPSTSSGRKSLSAPASGCCRAIFSEIPFRKRSSSSNSLGYTQI